MLDNEQHGGRPKSGDLGGTTELVPSENMGTVWIMDGLLSKGLFGMWEDAASGWGRGG